MFNKIFCLGHKPVAKACHRQIRAMTEFCSAETGERFSGQMTAWTHFVLFFKKLNASSSALSDPLREQLRLENSTKLLDYFMGSRSVLEKSYMLKEFIIFPQDMARWRIESFLPQLGCFYLREKSSATQGIPDIQYNFHHLVLVHQA